MTPDERDAQEWLRHARRGDFPAAWAVSDRILARHRAAPDVTRPRHLQSVWRGDRLIAEVTATLDSIRGRQDAGSSRVSATAPAPAGWGRPG